MMNWNVSDVSFLVNQENSKFLKLYRSEYVFHGNMTFDVQIMTCHTKLYPHKF